MKSSATIVCFLTCVFLSTGQILAAAQTQPASRDFVFGPGASQPQAIRVLPSMIYNDRTGFGFEPGTSVEAVDHGGDAPGDEFCTSSSPFYFSVKLPERNYKVTVVLGDSKGASDTTVKAELRRLMLEEIKTQPGQTVSKTFCVNLRTPKISTGGHVRLKPREKTTEKWAWDNKMTLEFNGHRPCLCSLKIERADDLPTIFILGDSTVCDQPVEPWDSWGQMLPRFFKPEVVVANNAESGETLRSSLHARRLDKVLSVMKPGDYLFIQYGHNDMKEKGPGVGAFTTYKADLKHFVDAARAHGGIPVLVTSMERKAGVKKPTLGDYPAAVRQLAKEENVPLIDLNEMSVMFYKALGPNLGKAFVDGTHHDNYGSYELAKCIIQGIRQDHLPLTRFIVDGLPDFDPSHPDPIDQFDVPPSPRHSDIKPEGS